MISFHTRRLDILKQLWKTLIQCHIDYCSQLYMPGQAQGMLALEKLLYDYTKNSRIKIGKLLEKARNIKDVFTGKKIRTISYYICLEGSRRPCTKLWSKPSSIECKIGPKMYYSKSEAQGSTSCSDATGAELPDKWSPPIKLYTKEVERNKNLSR